MPLMNTATRPAEQPDRQQAEIRWFRFNRWGYPGLVIWIYVLWSVYMLMADQWYLFHEFWPVAAAMSLGSFVAGATAEGGAAIAFPVFTKVLKIPAAEARTFGLMIQSVGMSMAASVILLRRIRFLPHVVRWVSPGGLFGMALGAFFLTIPNPYPRVLFTFVAAIFGAALSMSRWVLNWEPRSDLPGWDTRHRLLFMGIGVLGGISAANTGSGIGMLTFVVLPLAFGINEKISTPTTVIIMFCSP